MKRLILGSAGQIGTGLKEFLSNKNETVLTFDIATSLQEDLRIVGAAEEVIKECDFVYFLAFDVGGSRYLKKYQQTYNFISNNIKIINNTFDLLKKYDKPFIFASSQMANMDYSSYGTLKSIGQNYTKILNGLVVKFWNVYGYEKDLEKSHVITDFILSAKINKTIQMLTDGQEERQMLYVDDCCECLDILTSKYDSISRDEQLHITSFEWNKIIDIANLIAELLPPVNVIPGKTKDAVQLNKKNEPDKNILKHWQPKTDLRTGIGKVIDRINES